MLKLWLPRSPWVSFRDFDKSTQWAHQAKQAKSVVASSWDYTISTFCRSRVYTCIVGHIIRDMHAWFAWSKYHCEQVLEKKFASDCITGILHMRLTSAILRRVYDRYKSKAALDDCWYIVCEDKITGNHFPDEKNQEARLAVAESVKNLTAHSSTYSTIRCHGLTHQISLSFSCSSEKQMLIRYHHHPGLWCQ